MAELVGKTLKKEFKGFGFFNGVVNSFDPSTGYFEIVYEDGDSEELEFQEISSLLENRSGFIVNDQNQFGAADVTANKPKKKRRRVGDDTGIINTNSSNLMMGISSCLKGIGGEGLKEETACVVNEDLGLNLMNTSCGSGVRSETWLNLNDDGFDLNHGLSLHENGLDSRDGFDLNVGSEERLKKKNAFIDLNLDANGDFEENLKEDDLVVSVVGTQKRERCFDLNLGLDEEIKNSESECEGQVEENPSFRIVDENQKQEVEGTQMKAVAGSSENEVGDLCDGLLEEVPKGSVVSPGLEVDDSSRAMHSKDFLPSEVQLKEMEMEMLPDSGTPVDQSSYQGNSESPCQERKRRKRRKVLDNVNSATETVSRRRSSSRVAVALCTENDVSSEARSVACHEVSTPGAIEVKDFPSAEVQVEEGFPDGTPLDHGYRGSTGSTGKGRRGRKRKEILDSVDSARETVLRRSSRRLAATLSDQSYVSSGVILQELNEAHHSPAVSVVLEESEECSVLPSKLQLPPSSTNLNLDGIPILDLFSVYTCLRSFSTLLFLSPFELEDFVAALKTKVPNLLFDSIHVSLLQTLRRHLEFLSAENSESASNCLRSLNWDFLDLITWPMFMGEYLLIHGSELKTGLDLSKLKLFESDYYKQPTLVKIEILRCLCDDMIEVEGIRSELNKRTLAIELNIDTDRNMKIEASRKRTSLDISGGSCLTEDVVDEAKDWNSDECRLCKMDGSLICCDGCPEAYHLKCVGVANSLLPEGDWYCPECMIDKDKPWLKMGKSIRGAELLGVDPYGRFYYSSCGYLLVSDSCESGASYNYYRGNDLTSVIEALMSSDTLYRPILCAISKQWNIYVKSNGAKGYAGSHRPTVCLEIMKGQIPSLSPSETFVRDEISDEIKPQVNSVAAQSSGNADSEVSALVNNDPVTVNSSMKMENPLTSSEGSAETSRARRIKKIGKTGISNDSEIQGTILSVTTDLDAERGKNMESTDYVNSYNFARTASSVAEELSGNSSDKINVGSTKSLEDIISAQLKAISKKATKFSWPNIQSLNAEARKEKCGWCFSCRAPEDDGDCFINMNDSASDSTSEIADLGSKRNKKGHLVDVMGYILCLEDRLRAFLLGPWLNPHYSKIWRNNIVKASDVASLKHLLLMLESNLRRLALSAEWVKPVDSIATLGSASHVMTSSLRVSSKHGIGGKRGRSSDLLPNPSSKAATGLGLFWWRGGRLSRELFKWKVLPCSLASTAARQAGYAKIPGILYPESSEFANRSKFVAWRAAVETSRSVEQLALQVRELDSNIRWDEIENTNLLSKMDQFRKSVKSFKKAIIRRKCTEGTVVKYLLDFGKRRFIPDIVVTHGSKVEESSSGRKKYWLEEPHVPLYLLKTFEERRIARKTNKMSSGKLHWNDRVTKKSSKKRGFSYLFTKAERSENYQCGHCNKDVLIREAVSCQKCQGFFHKRHVRKSARAVTVKCKYTCHKCQDVNRVKVAAKKVKALSQKSTKVSTVCRILRSNSSKKTGKNKKPVQQQKNKKDTVVLPLRRSARRIQIVSLPNKKVGGRKKKKGKQIKPKKGISKKPKKCTWQKKRTGVYHSYWLNGLLLSRKSNDERVENFRSKVLLARSDQLTDMVDQPKCSLCCEQEFSSRLTYVGCEICGDWFHGDAIGLGVENISYLIGFRCHKCRNRAPPVCPHFHSTTTDSTKSGESNHMAIECAEEVSNVTALPTEILEENKCLTDEKSKNFHKDQESELFLSSNQLEAENEHLAESEEQKRDEIQIPIENSIRNSSPGSNEHVSMVENSSDDGRGDIGAVTDIIDSEMASTAHNNTEKDSVRNAILGSLEQKSLADSSESSELPCQAIVVSGETVDGEVTML